MQNELIAEPISKITARIIIVTGSSGAGKSSVLRILEDIDFFCVDNLPLELLESFIQLIGRSPKVGSYVALGVDVRGVEHIEQLVDLITQLKNRGMPITLLFLSATQNTLIKRFQETRRKHPLAHTQSITDAIDHEQKMLTPLRESADMVVETDTLTVHQLRSMIRSLFVAQAEKKIVVTIISFGFKYGIPHESNFMYDVRSLPNPYFIPALRPLSGLDQPVRDYLFAQPFVQEYWQKLHDFVRFAIDAAYAEGRSFITLSIGCTGGRHRSVALAEALAQQSYKQATCILKHRDITHENPG